MTKLRLLSRPDCHLCDFALVVLKETGLPVTPDIVNIEEDDALEARYGIRIPVFRREDTGAELDWPFDDDDLLEFLSP
jgi:hypothetical protein